MKQTGLVCHKVCCIAYILQVTLKTGLVNQEQQCEPHKLFMNTSTKSLYKPLSHFNIIGAVTANFPLFAKACAIWVILPVAMFLHCLHLAVATIRLNGIKTGWTQVDGSRMNVSNSR